jgi:hypothetical protein
MLTTHLRLIENKIFSLFKDQHLSSCMIILLATIITALSAILLLKTFYGDPSIYLIYARNMASGDFFSFNPGQFSSGSTSPLWALILSIGFVLGPGVVLSKWISLLAVLFALFTVYYSSSFINGSRLAGAFSIMVMMFYITAPGLQLYESSLIVIFISLSITLSQKIAVEGKEHLRKYLLGLAVIWSAIPLSRPDALYLIILNFLVLAFFFKDFKTRLLLLCALAFSLFPSLLYFGYSYMVTGSPSVAGYCRAFALKEHADRFLSVYYSLAAVKTMLKLPTVVWIAFALYGCWRHLREKSMLWLVHFFLLGLSGYVILLTFVSPVSGDVKRYLLPIITLMVPIACYSAIVAWNFALKRNSLILRTAIILYFVGLPSIYVTRMAVREGERGLNFDTITEKSTINYVNSLASPGDKVLAYEVQARFNLRSDVEMLSLDGITDGKVGPYLESADMESFLMQYKPDFWIANDAIHYRPYLSKGIMNRVVDQIGHSIGDSIIVGDILFKNIYVAEQNGPADFAFCRQIFQLSYR